MNDHDNYLKCILKVSQQFLDNDSDLFYIIIRINYQNYFGKPSVIKHFSSIELVKWPMCKSAMTVNKSFLEANALRIHDSNNNNISSRVKYEKDGEPKPNANYNFIILLVIIYSGPCAVVI